MITSWSGVTKLTVLTDRNPWDSLHVHLSPSPKWYCCDGQEGATLKIKWLCVVTLCEVNMIMQLWQRYANMPGRSLVQVLGGQIIGYPAPRHPEIVPGVTFCRDIVLKFLCLMCFWNIEIGQAKRRSFDQQATSSRITVWREFALHTRPSLWMWKDASPTSFYCADFTNKTK